MLKSKKIISILLIAVMMMAMSVTAYGVSKFAVNTDWGLWSGELYVTNVSGTDGRTKNVAARNQITDPNLNTRLYITLEAHDYDTDKILLNVDRYGDYNARVVTIEKEVTATGNSKKVKAYSANELIYTTGRVKYLSKLG